MPRIISSAPAMEALGADLAKSLKTPAVVYLRGELGTGKTTLVRGALHALGYKGLVKSPTFTLVESYSLPTHEIHHFDLYRINDAEELECIGIREYFNDASIGFIEWPDNGIAAIPAPTLEIQIHHAGNDRRVEISS